MPVCIVIPPGGENSMQVPHTVGFLRDGRKPSGPRMTLPGPSNGAPQMPQRGLLGSDRNRLLRTPPAPSSCSRQATAQSSGSSGSPVLRPAARRSFLTAIRCQRVSFACSSAAWLSAIARPYTRVPASARCGRLPRVEIRPATAADAEAIAAIYAHYVASSAVTFDETAPDAEAMARTLASVTGASLPFLVAASGERVEGYAYLAPYKDRSAYRYTVENSVYVSVDARGRGVGRAL